MGGGWKRSRGGEAALLETGANPGAIDLSAITGNVRTAKLLLAKKVDVDAKSTAGDSPSLAAMDDRVKMLRFLAEQGNNLDGQEGLMPYAQAPTLETNCPDCIIGASSSSRPAPPA